MMKHADMWKELIKCHCDECSKRKMSKEERIHSLFFYHSFPRRRGDVSNFNNKGLQILKSIVKNGLLLNAETTKWKEPLQNGKLSEPVNSTSISCSFTLLEEYEIHRHRSVFGPFSLEYNIEKLMKFGVMPVHYLINPTQYFNSLEAIGSSFMCRLTEIAWLVDRIRKEFDIRKIEHSNPPYTVDIEHHINAIHRMASLFYPTERIGDNEILKYYRQREWRIIGSLMINNIEITKYLTQYQKEEISNIDPTFFNGEIANRNGDMKRRLDLCQIFNEFNNEKLIECANRIIVPSNALEETQRVVEVLGNPPPVVAIEQIPEAIIVK